MKIQIPKCKIEDVILVLVMLVFGVGIFSFLLTRVGITFQDSFVIAIPSAAIWTLIGWIGSKIDEDKKRAQQAISDAVVETLKRMNKI